MGVLRVTFLFVLLTTTSIAFAKNDKVRLKEVEVLSLGAGRMTTGRRSSPVPQLTCVGGSAGCSAVNPPVVQCYNRGWDGNDVQWECKADMDSRYKFGRIEVTCEGYDYPDDPYILVGSCGLEYTIESRGGGGGAKYTDDIGWKTQGSSGKEWLGSLLFWAVVALVVYAFYKTCIAPEHMDARSRTSDDFSGRRPPPPGWNTGSYGGSDHSTGGSGGGGFFSSSDSCSGSQTRNTNPAGGGLGGAGGFWTGAATGGLLGYMMGNRNTGNTGWGGGMGGARHTSWGGGGGGSSFGGGGASTSSSSGFGGTRRR